MPKYAVIGHPVGHSRSPGMQNAAFKSCGLDADYVKMEVDPAEFPAYIEYAKRRLLGFNLTVPHKQIVLPYLDEIAPEAKRIGSVNTVKILPGGKLSGCSTDGVGFEEAVRFKLGMELAGKSVLLLGCGGAARALAFRISGCGAKRLYIANRSVDKAAALTAELEIPAEALPIADSDAVSAALAECDLLVQATSLGLHADDAPPIDLALLDGRRGSALAVMDLIYLATPLLVRARRNGLKCCDGREMLLRQGASSFTFWTGMRPDIEAMRAGMENEDVHTPPFEWRQDHGDDGAERA